MTVATDSAVVAETEVLAAVSTEALICELYARSVNVEGGAFPVVAAMLEKHGRILGRVEALLDAVDRHPLARRWLGLP